MKHSFACWLVAILAFIPGISAWAQTDTALSPIGDSYVSTSNKATNYGGGDRLIIKNGVGSSGAASYFRHSLLKFDLSGFSFDDYQDATLVLNLVNSNTHVSDMTWQLWRVSDNSWSESAVTWNNQPAVDSSLGIIAAVHGQPHPYTAHFIIPAAVIQTAVENTGVLSLALRENVNEFGDGDAGFASKENADPSLRPVLMLKGVSIDTVPEEPGDNNSPNVFDTIIQNIRQVMVDKLPDMTTLVEKVSNSLDPAIFDAQTGIWSDIDYGSTARTNPSWNDAQKRMADMVYCYTLDREGNIYYQDTVLYQAIVNAFRYYISQRPKSTNWYYMAITGPQGIATVLLNMRFGQRQLPADVVEAANAYMCKDTAVNAAGRNNPLHSLNNGSNQTLVAMGWLMIGSLIEQEYMVQVGAQTTYAPIVMTSSGEGIQYDLSYLMHFGYYYLGSYGLNLFTSVAEASYYLSGTRLAAIEPYLPLFRQFSTESLAGITRWGYIDWNTRGRSIAFPNSSDVKNIAIDYGYMQKVDTAHTALYDTVIGRLNRQNPPDFGVPAFNRQYWKSDFSLHTRPGFYFSAHAISNRTYSNEMGNAENLLGFWTGIGATNINVQGDEYYNIYPVWNWTHIPGTTTPDSLVVAPTGTATGTLARKGTSSFSGGVTDSTIGVFATVVNNDHGISARKSWFEFDKEIICLGAGITGTSGFAINTTVNQTLFRNGPAIISSNGATSSIGLGAHTQFAGDLDWVIQDHIGYVFPSGGNVDLLTEHRENDWLDINRDGGAHNTDIIKKDIFQLSLEHGTGPVNDKYAYYLVPNINSANEMNSYLTEENIQVAVNSDSIQAVYNRRAQTWGFVFYNGAKIFTNDSVRIQTSVPCVMMVQRLSDARYKISVADPAHANSTVTVVAGLPGLNGERLVHVALPGGNYAGRSAVAYLDLSSQQAPPTVDIAHPENYIIDTLYPVSDTYVRQASSNTNFGASTKMESKPDPNAANRDAYLKFDLSQINTTPDSLVRVAIQATTSNVDATATFSEYKWDLWQVPAQFDDWTEGPGGWGGTSMSGQPYTQGLTYANTHGTGKMYNETMADSGHMIATTGMVAFTPSTIGWSSDLNSMLNKGLLGAVQEKLNGNKTFSVLINGYRPDIKADVIFLSKEEALQNPDSSSYIPVMYVWRLKPFEDFTTPVHFVNDLKAARSGSSVRLTWSTSSGSRIRYFVVEKSIDGTHFDSLATVYPEKVKGAIINYSYEDLQPRKGINYYRIKLVDDNIRQSSYSHTVRINYLSAPRQVDAWYLYPNPVGRGESVKINFNGLKPGDAYLIRLFTLGGHLIKSVRKAANGAGVTFSFEGLTSGLYIMDVSDIHGKRLGSPQKIVVR